MQAANASPTDCGFSHGKPRNPCIFQQGPYLVGFFWRIGTYSWSHISRRLEKMSTKRATCWSRGGKNLKKHVDGRPINHHKSMTFCANSGVAID